MAHGLFAPVSFFGTAFPFFVFSCGWLVWRRHSFGRAFWAAALPHALQNPTAFALVLWG